MERGGLEIRPDRDEFLRLAERYRTIPVWAAWSADLDTPVRAFASLFSEADCAFLLESAEQDQRAGRFSFVGGEPEILYLFRDGVARIERLDGSVREFETGDPLRPLDEMALRLREVYIPRGFPPFFAGAVGYLAYDAVRYFEPAVGELPPDDLSLPECAALWVGSLLVFDHWQRAVTAVACAFLGEGVDPLEAYGAARERVTSLYSRLRRSSPELPLVASGEAPEVDPGGSNFRREEFEDAVRAAKGYIRRGDIFQVVLSQRFSRPTRAGDLDIYRALRMVNPSPYMFLLRLPGASLVGSSPEMLVRVRGDTVEQRPIAGTRPRGKDPEEDTALERDLLSDGKERAEHVMLVDLARNDVGRISEPGTVRVPELMVVERYSHVMHIVSHVEGRLAKGFPATDALRASFPAGTVSGAPKVRAMQIISELEPVRRGPYAGSVFYFSASGDLDSCITIRTVLLKDGTAYVQAGAGIVWDSVPSREFEETVNKAKGMFAAIALAEEVREVGSRNR